jgi:hypothetical protein
VRRVIKARLTGHDGAGILLLGLSHANLDKLRADGMKGFIKIKAADIGGAPFDIMSTAAPSEADMADMLSEFIGPETKVHIDEKLKS